MTYRLFLIIVKWPSEGSNLNPEKPQSPDLFPLQSSSSKLCLQSLVSASSPLRTWYYCPVSMRSPDAWTDESVADVRQVETSGQPPDHPHEWLDLNNFLAVLEGVYSIQEPHQLRRTADDHRHTLGLIQAFEEAHNHRPDIKKLIRLRRVILETVWNGDQHAPTPRTTFTGFPSSSPDRSSYFKLKNRIGRKWFSQDSENVRFLVTSRKGVKPRSRLLAKKPQDEVVIKASTEQEDSCVICLEPLETVPSSSSMTNLIDAGSHELETLPQCNHRFHKKCINRWISQVGSWSSEKPATCPLCRAPALPESKVYPQSSLPTSNQVLITDAPSSQLSQLMSIVYNILHHYSGRFWSHFVTRLTTHSR